MGMEVVQGVYRHEQTTPASSWTITHNLGTKSPVVDVWVSVFGTMTKILPSSVVATSDKVVTITFSVARDGRALVV